jgi:hypothetical protein
MNSDHKSYGFFKPSVYLEGLLVVFIIFMSACEKDGKDDVLSMSYDLQEFDTIRVEGPLNLFLTTDPERTMTVTGNRAIVKEVHYHIVNGVLHLTSDYAYKMFKPAANKADIHLTIPSLSRIDVAEACGITSTDTLPADELGLVVEAKYADIDLKLNCRSFYYWDYSLSGGRIRLEGNTDVLKIWNFSLMTIDARNLNSENVICENHARSNCYIRSSRQLYYSIFGQGDIYYSGDPDEIIRGEITSTGRLIKME